MRIPKCALKDIVEARDGKKVETNPAMSYASVLFRDRIMFPLAHSNADIKQTGYSQSASFGSM
jgi:hypothetical protein